MDESLLELESELKRLSPRGLPPALLAKVEAELGSSPSATKAPGRRYSTATSLRLWKWVSWSLAGAAAAGIALAAILQIRHQAPAVEPASPATLATTASAQPETSAALPATTNRYEPIQATSVLYDLQEGAPATLPDQTEGRAVRYRYVDTYTWKNPATNASLRWSLPRDEVRLVRTNLN